MPAACCRRSTTAHRFHSPALSPDGRTDRDDHGDVPRFRRPRSPVRLVRQVAAGVLACLALLLALRPPPPGPETAAQRTVPVVVAATDLPAGATLTAGHLATAFLPADATPAGAATDIDQLSGQVLAAPVRGGEPVTDVRVVGPGLWSRVPDGLVAAPVRLADLAVATLLRAGDRVDVLAAAAAPDGAVPAAAVVAEAALVLAVPADADPGSSVPAPGAGLLVLAVPPETARQLAAAGAGASLTVTFGRP
jgi:Flp pilus assembly protein CpaB